MIGNMLNDLAKAIRRWTEKKHEGVGRKKSVATLFWRQVDQHPNELTSTIGS